MFCSTWLRSLTLLLFISAAPALFAYDDHGEYPGAAPLIWRDLGNISLRDLEFGPGSPALVPLPPFRFVEEEKDGESPKFRVEDANGTTWVVKLGPESQTETVATRLVWAVGYFTEEAYYMHRATIQGLPRLSRGRSFVEREGVVRGARFEPRRANVKRGPTWKWLKNPFVGTREINGLKVLMVLLANYDTSTANNRIFSIGLPGSSRKEQIYLVTDLGATFGHVGGFGGHRSKNTLEDFRAGKFVRKVENGMVEFDYHTQPTRFGIFPALFNPIYWKEQANKEKAMRHVPVEHARWIGGLLSRLTNDQLSDAFRAAGYGNDTSEGFIKVLRDRIRQLTHLTPRSRTRRNPKA